MGNAAQKEIPDLTGQVFIVTGASAGIGKVCVQEFAKKGAKVILAIRDTEKGEKCIKEMKESCEEELDLEIIELNLASLQSVKKFSEEFLSKNYPLHCLLNNAGIMLLTYLSKTPPFSLTEEGIEVQFGVNHCGHFYLTRLLKDKLIETANNDGSSRVVNVSSMGHQMTYKTGIRFDKISDEKSYSAAKAYGQSKLANILFANKLNDLLGDKNVYCNSLHPGVIYTELARHMDSTYGFLGKMAQTGGKLFTTAPAEGALTSIYVATSDEIVENNIKGKYYVPVAKLSETSNFGKSENLKNQLWDFTEELLSEKLGEDYVKWD